MDVKGESPEILSTHCIVFLNYKPCSHWELSIFGGNFTTKTKKKSFIKGEWGLSRWKCTWCVFVSVSAVSLCSQKAGAELFMCLLAQVYYVFHVLVSEVRECGELVIVPPRVGVNSCVSVLLGSEQGGELTLSATCRWSGATRLFFLFYLFILWPALNALII